MCITTDGASVMQKVGKLFPCLQQLCLIHVVQLAVLDVLYKKPKFTSIEAPTDGTDSESDNRDKVGEFQIFSKKDDPELIDNLYPFIRKVRTIVKIFCKSSIKNDILQKHIKEHFGKEIQIMIDGILNDTIFETPNNIVRFCDQLMQWIAYLKKLITVKLLSNRNHNYQRNLISIDIYIYIINFQVEMFDNEFERLLLKLLLRT